MKKFAIAAFLATIGLAAVPATSSAMTAAPGVAAGTSVLQDIAYGCGRGFVPNKWGRCVPAGGYRVAPRYGYGYNSGPIPTNRSGYGRVCPRGTRPGPRGGYCH